MFIFSACASCSCFRIGISLSFCVCGIYENRVSGTELVFCGVLVNVVGSGGVGFGTE